MYISYRPAEADLIQEQSDLIEVLSYLPTIV